MKFLNYLFLFVFLLSVVSQVYSAKMKSQRPRRSYYFQSRMKTNETKPRRSYYIQKESIERAKK